MIKHTCPRRMTELGPWEREEGLDSWGRGHGLISQERGCTFCGSMHPDDFMKAVRDGLEIGPTDKSYKFYVDSHGGKFYTHHLQGDYADEFVRLWDANEINWGYPGHPYVRLYVPGYPK